MSECEIKGILDVCQNEFRQLNGFMADIQPQFISDIKMCLCKFKNPLILFRRNLVDPALGCISDINVVGSVADEMYAECLCGEDFNIFGVEDCSYFLVNSSGGIVSIPQYKKSVDDYGKSIFIILVSGDND